MSLLHTQYHEKRDKTAVRVVDVLRLVANKRVGAFLFAVIIVGLMTAMQWNFFFMCVQFSQGWSCG